jgi:hypothetical protein
MERYLKVKSKKRGRPLFFPSPFFLDFKYQRVEITVLMHAKLSAVQELPGTRRYDFLSLPDGRI